MQNSIEKIYLNKFQRIINPTTINLAGLTLLYGPNSVGKSAIHDALEIFKNIFIENKSKFNLLTQIEKNNPHMKSNGGTAIGLEIKVNKHIGNYHHSEIQPQVNEWSNTPSGFSDEYPHIDFTNNLTKNRIQIEISQGGYLKIAINNEKLIEFTDELQCLDKCQNILERAKWDDEFEEYGLYQKIRIYKKCAEKYNLPIEFNRYSKDSIYEGNEFLNKLVRIFIHEDENILDVRGIKFNGIDNYFDESLISLESGTNNILWEEPREYDEGERKKYIQKHFSKTSPYYNKSHQARSSIYWYLVEITQKLNLCVRGIFFQVRDALDYTHVRGDRGIINSDVPAWVARDLKGIETLQIGKIVDYALGYREPCHPNFINYSIKRYLPSIKHHKIKLEKFALVELTEKYNIKNSSDLSSAIVKIKVTDQLGRLQNLKDVGSGVSYILPILIAIGYSKHNFIEQPELHLHPRAQGEIADAILAGFNFGSRAVVESHSEHLLLRLLRRIRETTKNNQKNGDLTLKAEDLHIYYFEPIGNLTKVKKINVDNHGELLNTWPFGFFTERDEDIFYE